MIILPGTIITVIKNKPGIIIPKHGRTSHNNINDWRTINLTPCLLKLLEKCVLLYLNDTLNIDDTLDHAQMGFRKGRSTDEALHRLVSLIESSLVTGQYALTCFIDIKSAFDSITFKSIIMALKTANIPNPLINWITNLLGQRQIVYNLKGVSLIRYLIKGTPQGGV